MKTISILLCLLAFIIQSNYAQHRSVLTSRDTVFTSATGKTVDAQVGQLTVPENRAQPGSRMIKIDFVRLKCLGKSSGSPLFYLEGGGVPCTGQAYDPERLEHWVGYLNISDVILVDQRGTRDRDLLWISNLAYPEEFLVSEQAAGEHWKQMSACALQVFREKGIDIGGYTVFENAKDLVVLRQSLQVDRYSILGFSFGTHLGIALIQLDGDHIDDVVFAATDGLEHAFNYPSHLDMQVRKIAKMAAEGSGVKESVPDFEELLMRVTQKLDASPVVVQVMNPLSGAPMNVKVGSFGLAFLLRLDIDDATDIPVIPKLLYDIDHGDYSALKWFVQKRIVFAFAISGNGLTQGLASGASVERYRRIEEEASRSIFGNVVNFPFWHVREIWPASALPGDFRRQVERGVRTLFISGDLDCRTPSSQTEEIAKGFPNSTHLIVENAGHEQLLTNTEIIKTIQRFLAGEEVEGLKVTNPEIQFIPTTGRSETISHPAITNN